MSALLVLVASLTYLALLFLLAWLAERGTIPLSVTRHPLTYILSLGVYATSWSFYGSVGLAQDGGFLFLAIYLGLTVTMALTPVLLLPIFRLVRDYQLSSLADLFAFRYRHSSVGAWVTLAMLVGLIPYLALQIRAVTQSILLLTTDIPSDHLALAFCVVLLVFAILFGARHLTPRDQHEGLVVAIAFESIVKLVALTAVGLFAVFGVFGGLDGLGTWVENNPESLHALYAPVQEGSWVSLMVLSFCAAFLLPRQFHMMFTENNNAKSLRTASWGFPVYLLLLNLPIIPILWAGKSVAPNISADLYVMIVSMSADTTWLSLLTLIGGISAASGMMIVATLSLSSMVLNHWFAPAGMSTSKAQQNIYTALIWTKRTAITLIILCAFGFYQIIQHNSGLAQMGLISFVAIAQFLPGVIGLLFWQRANSTGFLLGLCGGFLMWFGILIVPLLVNSEILNQQIDLAAVFGNAGGDIWSVATFWTLTTNTVLLVLGSIFKKSSVDEAEAAELCMYQGSRPLTGTVVALSPQQFSQQLEQVMGQEAAEQEVRTALREVHLGWSERRPAELRRLRERIERNLSGLLGPAMARLIVNERLQLHQETHAALSDSFKYIEARLENSDIRLSGAQRELDEMRRYHRDVLLKLPIGVCALDTHNNIVIWNSAMEHMSGIDAASALGQQTHVLNSPWQELLSDFANGVSAHVLKQRIVRNNIAHSYNLHKSNIQTSASSPAAKHGLVMLVEDRTNIDQLENDLAHNERLASIGRFAAGVAHEIGNPLTCIDSLAQNIAHETEDAFALASGQQIVKQTRRINDIVKSLLEFSRKESAQTSSRALFPLENCIKEALELLKLDPNAHGIQVRSDCPAELKIIANEQKVLQLLINLISNACAASTAGTSVFVKACRMGETCLLEVVDQGSGMEPSTKDTIFEPFFTTKTAGQGTGLGLSVVHSIVKDHNGRIRVDTAPGQGSRFRITLPRTCIDLSSESYAL